MPGLFISHSSKDKTFVRQLAVDLLNEDFPVWLDEWELEAGSSLTNKIYDGIDDSTFFIVVISKNSIESGWVKKELTGALAKEEQVNRKFVIPIRLDDCQFPLPIADRMYSDFSKGYLGALETLVAVLKRYNIHKISVPPEKYLIPLNLKRGIYLDAGALRKRVDNLVRIAPVGFEISPHQFVLSPDEEYRKLREKLTYRMENIERDHYFSAEFHESFATVYRGILSMENDFLEGLSMIISEIVLKRQISFYDYADACKWFTLLIRSNILYRLWSAQNPSLPDVSSYGSDCIVTIGSDPKIYSVNALTKVYISPRAPEYSGTYLSIHIDAAESIHQDILVEGYPVRCSLRAVGNRWVFSKYIVPQMVVQFFLHFSSSPPLSWDFEGYEIFPDY